jgi:protein-arginine kinase activator protein McsA
MQIQYNEGMAKRNSKLGGYDKFKATIVKIIATKRGVSKDYVYKVLRGDRKEHNIVQEYEAAREALAKVVEKLTPND